jgi:hypothetical protein
MVCSNARSAKRYRSPPGRADRAAGADGCGARLAAKRTGLLRYWQCRIRSLTNQGVIRAKSRRGAVDSFGGGTSPPRRPCWGSDPLGAPGLTNPSTLFASFRRFLHVDGAPAGAAGDPVNARVRQLDSGSSVASIFRPAGTEYRALTNTPGDSSASAGIRGHSQGSPHIGMSLLSSQPGAHPSGGRADGFAFLHGSHETAARRADGTRRRCHDCGHEHDGLRLRKSSGTVSRSGARTPGDSRCGESGVHGEATSGRAPQKFGGMREPRTRPRLPPTLISVVRRKKGRENKKIDFPSCFLFNGHFGAAEHRRSPPRPCRGRRCIGPQRSLQDCCKTLTRGTAPRWGIFLTASGPT